MTNILEKIAFGWLNTEKEFDKNKPCNDEFYEHTFTGNPRTNYQIKNWISPQTQKINEEFQKWDGKSELKFEFIEKGEISLFSEAFKKSKIPKKLPEFGYLEMYKSSKITDFVHSDFLENSGMMVSQKAKSILEKFEIGNFRFYPILIEHKDTKYPYFFFRCDNNFDDKVDIENSSFYIQKPSSFDASDRVNKKFKNHKEIELFLSKNQGLDYDDKSFVYLDQVTFQAGVFLSDILFLKRYMSGRSKMYISKHLKEALCECSGIKFEPTKRIKNVANTQ